MDQYRQIEALLAIHSQVRFRAVPPALGGWAISADFGAVLLRWIQEHRPRTILDLGGGASTILAGYCLEQLGRGQVVAVDHSERFAAATAADIRRHGLESVAAVRHAPLMDLSIEGEIWPWYDRAVFADLNEIDLLIVDGPPQHNNPRAMARYPALPVLYERLNADALILIDDAARSHEQQMTASWLRLFGVDRIEAPRTEKGTLVLRKRRAGVVLSEAGRGDSG